MAEQKHSRSGLRLLGIGVVLVAALALAYCAYRSSGGSSAVATRAHLSAASSSEPSSVSSANSASPDTTQSDQTRLSNTRSTSQAESIPVQSGAAIALCHRALLQKKYMERDQCDDVPPEESARFQACWQGRDIDFARMQQLSAQIAACPQSLEKASNYYEALRVAALSGDANSQRCFLAGAFNDVDAGDRISPSQVDQYLGLARQFIQGALDRGDWSVVYWLARMRLDVSDGLLHQAYPFGADSPETLYKMNYLLTLGSRAGAGATVPQQIVKTYRSNGELSREQLQAAEQWAQETYARAFAGTRYDEEEALGSFCKEE